MHYKCKTKHVCAKEIEFDLDDDIVTNIQFHGGCLGNLKAITALLEAQKVSYIIEKLKNIRCGDKSTSCTAELAKALEEITT